ncbi:acyl-CoA reductase [Paenibacillus sp. SGZ-1009]|uniref:acyl-CoA reductase n=1 Tax=Paenibacillus campi TaxID=3106031 RepID=UPI002AFFD19F|nr:acyl-CoA reductase [Paenibacillus sp. SGZ-1009]
MDIIAPITGTIADADWKVAIQQVVKQRNLSPFQHTAVQFLEALSKHILLDRSMRAYPELMAMAHWLRKAHIMELQQQYEQRTAGKYVLPRGTVIHFAPANVDSVFIYSWILSMLAGNKNIIRLSRRTNEQTDLLLRKLNDVLAREPFQAIADRTLLVRYGYEQEYTAYLSGVCNVRVLWGGDQSVRTIRAIPLAPNAVELVFPNRYSKCVLSAQAVLAADESSIAGLGKQFYNDALWYGQLACSSPRELFWIGEAEAITAAKARFWHSMEQTMQKEQYQNEPALNLLRLTTADYYAAQQQTVQVQTGYASAPVRVEVKEQNFTLRDLHCGGGLFLEYSLSELEQLHSHIHDRDQTLSYFGFERQQLAEWAIGIPNRGVDRIVPVGQALNFGSVWDGYDLFIYFSREIAIG